jgi:small-conductance mechanosensitive channel
MRFYHNDSDRIRVRDQVALAIVAALAEAGISMPTPELIIYQSPTADAVESAEKR